LDNTKISYYFRRNRDKSGIKIRHYEKRKSFRNILCVAFMLCEALCACVVMGTSYSNVADKGSANTREVSGMWPQFKERRGEPVYFIQSIAFPTAFQEHYDRWWKCITTSANCFDEINT
jgi:hypothetical protein